MKKMIDIPKGCELVKDTDESGATIYRVHRVEYDDANIKKIKKLQDIGEIIYKLEGSESLVMFHKNILAQETTPYSVYIRTTVEMIVKAFRNGWDLLDQVGEFPKYEDLSNIYAPYFNLYTRKIEIESISTGMVGCPLELCVPSREVCEYMVNTFHKEFYEYFTCKLTANNNGSK